MMNRITKRNHRTVWSRRGFSLVEMMVVILLFGIIATIAMPPMFRYLQSNRLQTNTDRMIADLQYARAMAIATGQTMRFSNTTGGYTLTNTGTNSVLRQTNFDHGLGLALPHNTNFYPWGMADATVYNVSNNAGAKQISLLPTGIVEVQ